MSAKDTLEFSFKHFNLNLPSDFQRIEANDDDSESFTTLLYSQNEGSQYISISLRGHDIPSEEKKAQCDLDVILKFAFKGFKQKSCNAKRVAIYQSIFVEGRENSHWTHKDFTLYYSGKLGDSYLFIVGPENKVIRIDSDFLTKADFEQLASLL